MVEGVRGGLGKGDFQQIYVACILGLAIRVVLGLDDGEGGGKGGGVGAGGGGDELELQTGWLEI